MKSEKQWLLEKQEEWNIKKDLKISELEQEILELKKNLKQHECATDAITPWLTSSMNDIYSTYREAYFDCFDGDKL